jgi:hypothetical protein
VYGKARGSIIHQPKTTLNIISGKDGGDTLVFFYIIEGAGAEQKASGQKEYRY